MKFIRILLTAALMIGLSGKAAALSFPFTQATFDTFSNEVGSASMYRAVAPAEPLGLIGFDLSVEATTASIDGQSVILPKIKVQKGLPANLDIAGYYTQLPLSAIVGSDGIAYGVALSYAIVEGSTTTPALAVRGSYTSLDVPTVINTNTLGVDLSVSKGLGPVTPYTGIGYVQISSTDKTGVTTFTSNSSGNRYFVGANIALGFMSLALEGDQTAGVQTYSIKFGFRF